MPSVHPASNKAETAWRRAQPIIPSEIPAATKATPIALNINSGSGMGAPPERAPFPRFERGRSHQERHRKLTRLLLGAFKADRDEDIVTQHGHRLAHTK